MGASSAETVRVPRARSATTSAYRPSAAAAAIRGISAVMIETATMPCAIINSRKTLLKISGPAASSSPAREQVEHHEQTELADRDVAEHPGAEPAQLA